MAELEWFERAGGGAYVSRTDIGEYLVIERPDGWRFEFNGNPDVQRFQSAVSCKVRAEEHYIDMINRPSDAEVYPPESLVEVDENGAARMLGQLRVIEIIAGQALGGRVKVDWALKNIEAHARVGLGGVDDG